MDNVERKGAVNMETAKNMFKFSVTGIGTVGVYLLGGIDDVLITLIIFMILDYITGIVRAITLGNMSSKIGVLGIIKKVFLLAIVVMGNQIDYVSGSGYLIRTTVITFLIANEGISILENMALMGLPIPKVLLRTLEVWKEKSENVAPAEPVKLPNGTDGEVAKDEEYMEMLFGGKEIDKNE